MSAYEVGCCSPESYKSNGAHAIVPGVGYAYSLPWRRKRREHESLHKLRLPLQTLNRLGKVDPFASALATLKPIALKRDRVELVEMVRCRRTVNRRDVFRDRAVHARCS